MPKVLNPSKSIKRAKKALPSSVKWHFNVGDKEFEWSSKMQRVELIRVGLPFESVEVLSKSSELSVKQILHFLHLPQTTYNKKKKANELLSSKDSEIILVLTELLAFGLSVFNQEKEKFNRWLKKPSHSLNGQSPESLFDTLTGIQEVKKSLNRIEFGNMS